MKNTIEIPKTAYRRLFIALPLPETAKAEIKKNLHNVPGKNLSEDKWHLTLVFLGNIAEERLALLYSIFNKLVLPTTFEIVLSHIGTFPNPRMTQVLWLGFKDEKKELDTLSALFWLFKEELSKENFVIGNRPFIPHLTISRFANPENIENWLMQTSLPEIKIKIKINKVVLFQSIITKDQSCYVELLSRELTV